MKQMTRIIPIISILIINVLILLYMDFKESQSYLEFKNYNTEIMFIDYNNDKEKTIKTIENIQSLARKNNVIIAKSNVDNVYKNGRNVYLSLENIDELVKLLKENFNVKLFNNIVKTDESFISTYKCNDKNQIGKIDDLLDNNYYTYYLMSEIMNKNGSLYGDYLIFYNDFKDYSIFINEVNNLVGYDTHSYSFFTSFEKYILILMSGCLLLLLLFYFVFQVYEYYNNSKKIGCMKLLGFDMNKINKNMINKNLKTYIISIFVIVTLVMFFVKNIMVSHILSIVVVDLLIVLLTYIISKYSCKIISKQYETTNILKKQNIVLRVSKFSYILKTIMTILLVLFVIITFETINGLYDDLKVYNASKNLLEYGVIDSFVPDQLELFEYEKQFNFYINIINDKNLETFYAQFPNYSQLTDNDILNMKKAEEEGKEFFYGSVDKEYLKREKISIYDLNGKEIKIDRINGIYFIFPKSKKRLIDAFYNYYKESSKDYYFSNNAEFIFNAYLYDDVILDTYRMELKSKYVESPILRVIDNSINRPYFHNPIGISVFGNTMNTGLKIKINGNKEKMGKLLEKHINASGLTNLLSKSNFTTFAEYFDKEIQLAQLILLFLFTVILSITTVYILITFQVLILYIKSEKQKVLVKKLLGFKTNDIFESIFKKSLNSIILAFIISLIILILLKKLIIPIFLVILSLFLIIDFIIILLSIKLSNLSKIYLDLKGGNYD